MRDYDLTFSLALQHLEQLLDALVPGLQRLLLGLDARLELLEGEEGMEDVELERHTHPDRTRIRRPCS